MLTVSIKSSRNKDLFSSYANGREDMLKLFDSGGFKTLMFDTSCIIVIQADCSELALIYSQFPLLKKQGLNKVVYFVGNDALDIALNFS